MKLVASAIFGLGQIASGKPTDLADVIALGLLAELPDLHVEQRTARQALLIVPGASKMGVKPLI